jgi:hypothetical protein
MDPTTDNNTPEQAPEEQLLERSGTQVAFEEALRPIAIAVLLSCIVYAAAQFIGSISAGWPVLVHVGLAFVVSLESIQSWRLLERQDSELVDRIRFRFVEWVVIILVARFAIYLQLGGQRLVADMAHWAIKIVALLDPVFIVNLVTLAIVWSVALLLAKAFRELETHPLEIRPARTHHQSYLYEGMPFHGQVDRQAILRRITGVLFGGGIIMVVLVGFSRVDTQELIRLAQGRSEGIIVGVLIYFLVAFLLTSQARYGLLKAQWQLQAIPMLGDIGRRWAILALMFLAIVGLVAALLPVGYSVGIIAALSTALRWIIYVLAQIVFLILYVFSLLFSLIAGLFGSQDQPPTEMQRATPPPMVTDESGQGVPWWPLVRSLIFWTVAAGIIVYSLYHFVGYRSDLLKKLSLLRFVAWVRRTAARLWVVLGGAAHQVATRLREEIVRRLAARRAGAQRPWRYVSLRRLAPRDRVRYFYLSLLHRAEKQGFGRPQTWTPLEYAKMLEAELAASDLPVEELTAAFLEARYSEHSVDARQATAAQRAWRALKQAMAVRRRQASDTAEQQE